MVKVNLCIIDFISAGWMLSAEMRYVGQESLFTNEGKLGWEIMPDSGDQLLSCYTSQKDPTEKRYATRGGQAFAAIWNISISEIIKLHH